MGDAFAAPNHEPTLSALFAYPIIHQMMKRDGTTETAIRALLRRVTAAHQGRLPMPPDAVPPPDTPRPLNEAGALPASEPVWPRIFPSL